MAADVRWQQVEFGDSASDLATKDLLGIVWRRKWLVFTVLMLAVGLGMFYYLEAAPVFQSKAQLLLIKKESKQLPLAGVEGQQINYEDTLSTHLLLVRSPMIIGKAVERHNLGSLSSLRDAKDPVSAVIENLEAIKAGGKDAPDPNVMELTYRSYDPEDAAKVLGAVVESYQDFLGETYQDFSKQTIALISQAKDVLQVQKAEKEAAYREFRRKGPLILRDSVGNSVNLYETRMLEIEKARNQIVLNESETKARIETLEKALKSGVDEDALAILIENLGMLNSNSGVPTIQTMLASQSIGLKEKLFLAELEEQLLLEDFGQDHPKVQAKRKENGLIKQQIEQAASESGGKLEPLNSGQVIALYLKSLHEALKGERRKLENLDEQFAIEHEQAKKLSTFLLDDESFKNDLAATQALFDSVIKSLGEINLVKDHGGLRVQLISPPMFGQQVAPVLLKVLAAAIAVGLLAGAGMAFGIDMADKRFRNPQEISAQLGLPIVGHIPLINVKSNRRARSLGAPGTQKLDPMLCTVHEPTKHWAEAFRAVRTSLYFSTRGEGHKVVQITSPNAGDGKTTLSSNLAVSIANSGKRVLIVEADFRKPRVHRVFGLDSSVGVTSVITGQAEIPEAIQATPIQNLWAMPGGPRPNNPSELLTSRVFDDLLATVRDQYDFVIVDTPPVLAVSDASIVAPRVDGVILVLSLSKSARASAQHSTEILSGLGAKVFGIVVNRANEDKLYGYGSGYGYGYTDKSYLEGNSDETKVHKRRNGKMHAHNSHAPHTPSRN